MVTEMLQGCGDATVGAIKVVGLLVLVFQAPPQDDDHWILCRVYDPPGVLKYKLYPMLYELPLYMVSGKPDNSGSTAFSHITCRQ